MLQIAQYISYGLGLYALIGLLFGLYFICLLYTSPSPRDRG